MYVFRHIYLTFGNLHVHRSFLKRKNAYIAKAIHTDTTFLLVTWIVQGNEDNLSWVWSGPWDKASAGRGWSQDRVGKPR